MPIAARLEKWVWAMRQKSRLEAVVTQVEGRPLTSDKSSLLCIFPLLTEQGRLLGGGGSFPVTFPSWAQMGHVRRATLPVAQRPEHQRCFLPSPSR